MKLLIVKRELKNDLNNMMIMRCISFVCVFVLCCCICYFYIYIIIMFVFIYINCADCARILYKTNSKWCHHHFED